MITFPRLSSVAGAGWWIIGGVFGEVGEGRMIWSLKTALLALSRGGLNGSDSFSKLVARMEDCETPVDGAFAIKEAALGVVFCSTGLLINGRTVAVGVELFPSLPLNGAIVGLFSELRSGEDGRVEALGGGAGFVVVMMGEEGDFLSGDLSDCETVEEGLEAGLTAGSGFVAGNVGLAEAGGGGGGFVDRGDGVLAFDASGEDALGFDVDNVFGFESNWEKGETVTVLVGLTGGAEDWRKDD